MMENEELRRARFSGWELPPMRETNETIDAAELARRYDALLADRDRLAAENARLREFVADAIRSLAHEEGRLDSLREHAELEEFADLEVALASGTIATLLRAARSLTEAQP